MNRTSKVAKVRESGIHFATGKAWARLRGPLGWVEQWGDTEAEALTKCRAYIKKHHARGRSVT